MKTSCKVGSSVLSSMELGESSGTSSVSTALTIAPPVVRLWPEFSPQLRDLMLSIGVCSEHKPRQIFTKKLYESDIKRDQSRLLIPQKQIKEVFLSGLEEAQLIRGEKLDVKVIDPSLTVRDMSLSRWKNGKGNARYSYSLIKNWTGLVSDNGLVVDDIIQVWSFRYNLGSLGLIVIKDSTQVASSSSSSNSLPSWGKKRKRGSNSPAMK